MKRPITRCLAIVTLVAFLMAAVGACAMQAPSPTPVSVSKTTEAAPASKTTSAQTIELKLAFPYPEADEMWAGPEFMIKELQTRTGGRVKVTPYFAEALGKVMDTLDMLKDGTADIAMFPPLFTKPMPISGIFTVPGLRIPNRAASHELAYTLWEKGLLKKDFETTGLKPLMWLGTDPMAFAFKSKITTLEELRKLKMRSPPGISSDAVTALGASVVNMPAQEVYMALDRGVVDGLVTMPGSYFSVKMNEVAKYWLDLPLGTGANIVAMSQDKWNKLPPDVQQTWEEINREARDYFLKEMERRHPDRLAEFKKAGVEVYTISQEEAERWYKLVDPVTDKWIADAEAAGYPGKAAVETAREVVKKHSQR